MVRGTPGSSVALVLQAHSTRIDHGGGGGNADSGAQGKTTSSLLSEEEENESTSEMSEEGSEDHMSFLP
jgi:hypothetical protein